MSDMTLPRDRVVLVTGASSGIGRATAIAFARDGARVVAASRNRERLETLAREIGPSFLNVPCDVRRPEDVRAAVEAAVRRFGALHVVVANAGRGLYAAVEDTTDEDLDELFRTNVYGAVHLVRDSLPHLRRSRGSQIIVVGSVLSRASLPYMAGYCMTKHALAAFADALRMELADEGIDVLLVGPGLTATDFQRNAINRIRGFNPVRESSGGQSPETVARAILRASKRRKREVHLTADGKLLVWFRKWFPKAADWGILRWVRSRKSRPNGGE